MGKRFQERKTGAAPKGVRRMGEEAMASQARCPGDHLVCSPCGKKWAMPRLARVCFWGCPAPEVLLSLLPSARFYQGNAG